MSNDPISYVNEIKKAQVEAVVVDADWDGNSSDWFEVPKGTPIVGLMFKDLVVGDLTIHVSDTSAGTDAYLLGVSEDLTGKADEVAIFVPELAPFRYARVTSTGTQVNGIIKLVRSA